MTYTYKATTKEATGLFTDGRIRTGNQGVIVRSDGVEVWRGTIYTGDKRAPQLQANNMVSRYRYHFQKHGRCYYDEQQAARLDRKAWTEERNRLLDQLRGAVNRGVRTLTHPDKVDQIGLKPEWAEDSIEARIFALAMEAARALPPRPEGA